MSTAFFTATSQDCLLAENETTHNRRILERWCPFINERRAAGMTPTTIAKEIKQRVSKSMSKVKPLVNALIEFQRLPKSQAVAMELGHLDPDRIVAIGNKLRGVADEALDAIDEDFAQYLRPTLADEALVLARSMADHLGKLILEHDPGKREEPKASESKGKVHVDPDQRFRFSFSLPPVEGAAAYANLQAFCNKHGCGIGEAFQRIVAGEKRPKAVLNVYASPEGIAYLPGPGWLSDADARRLHLTKKQVISELISTLKYQPRKDIRAFVKGRDGSCRFPGCDVDALHCQLDHAVPHAKGGATSARNLHLLCQHHHNMKTNGEVSVVLGSDGTDTWTLADGSTAVTLPSGPLAGITDGG